MTGPTTFDGLVRAVAQVEPIHGAVIGTTLGGMYELVERIGGGGMGIVFRARDHRLGRDVAIKMLRVTSRESDLRRLFEREARATAQLLHPNIVTLHHVGDHDGTPYLVLELLAGETLATRLARRGELSIDESLAIVDGVLAAIGFAHQRGVLHRDLKPGNVFLTSDDRVKVLDFGIALAVDTDVGPVTRGAGTPGFMAPEQDAGGAQDERTDVWAVARLLVECLGKNAEVPRGLRTSLDRALDPVPANRPASAEELRALLRPARPAKRPARKPYVWIALAVIAAAIAIGAIVTRPAKLHPVTAAELEHVAFVADQGTMLFHVDPDGTAFGVYTRSDGILVGHFDAGTFTGRWCEQPTRRAPLNAGTTTLHFLRGETRLVIDGSWIVGENKDLPWRAGVLAMQGTPADPELVARLARRESCP
ncbi:MAG: serine/threonine-protein kinase [Kofleriaceae bacterium]